MKKTVLIKQYSLPPYSNMLRVNENLFCGYILLKEVVDWCNLTLKGSMAYKKNYEDDVLLYFEYEEDAILFKMRWL